MGKICDLIANKHTQLTEEDRPWLQELAEAQLDRMVPVVNEEEIVEGHLEGLSNSDVLQLVKDKGISVNSASPPPTLEAYVAAAPPAYRPALEGMLTANKARKDGLVTALVAVPGCPWTQEQLQAKDVTELEALQKFAVNSSSGNVDYRGNAGGTPPSSGTAKIEVLAAPSVDDYVVKAK